MIVLDTNVLSELMRPKPDARVLAWAAAQPRALLCTTAISQAEIEYGIATLPAGRRRSVLAAAADAVFTEDFADRVLPFESRAAKHYGEIVATRRRSGMPIDGFDALIAAIASVNRACVATRDIGGFAGIGLTLINPWEAS